MTNKIVSLSIPELLALLLFVPGPHGKIAEPITGRTRLMKIMFLLFKEANIKEIQKIDGEFIAFKFGPFSSKLLDSVEALKTLGIIEEGNRSSPGAEPSEWEEYSTDDQTTFKLTDQGIVRVQKLAEKISPELYKNLSNYKTIYSNRSLTEILQYVYSKYPEFAIRSEAVV